MPSSSILFCRYFVFNKSSENTKQLIKKNGKPIQRTGQFFWFLFFIIGLELVSTRILLSWKHSFIIWHYSTNRGMQFYANANYSNNQYSSNHKPNSNKLSKQPETICLSKPVRNVSDVGKLDIIIKLTHRRIVCVGESV